MTLIQRKGTDTWTAIEPIDGKKKWWNTGTANKRTAGRRAKVYYDGLRQGKFDEIADLVRRKARVLTVGEFLKHYEELCVKKTATDTGIRRSTFLTYRTGIRCIIGLVLNPNFTKGRCQLKATERNKRNSLVDKQPLTVLDSHLIRQYIKLAHGRAAGTEDLKSIKRGIVSRVTDARSLLSAKTYQIFAEDNITLPVLSDFMSYKVERGCAVRYKAPADKSLAPRTHAASKQLKLDDPEAYKVYLLAYIAGLRKSEIENAKVFWLEDHEIKIQSSGDYLTKNGHDREIPLPSDAYNELIEMTSAMGDDDYILNGTMTDRARKIPDRVRSWLAALGWTKELTGSNKKLHALRANYISHMAKVAGIHVAQHLAGHADYSTTDRHYADPDVKVAREA